MNSDPHDSAAWRSFGMLDADESSAFDDAARHDSGLKHSIREIDQLSAAIALAASQPVRPSPGHLERIRKRLALPHETRMPWWLGLSGWAAAAVLALLMVWQADKPSPTRGGNTGTVGRVASPLRPLNPDAPSPQEKESVANDSSDENDSADRTKNDQAAPSRTASSNTERLAREIALLQDRLGAYEERERALFQTVPGVALPVIMKMSPPGVDPDRDPSLALNDSPVHQLFSSRAETADKQGDQGVLDVAAVSDAPPPPVPAAIPIYDSARDAGTLVLSNLPPAPEGREYNLWARTKAGAAPVRIGILPDAGTSPSESFDFSLGTTQIVPAGFILTQDPVDSPAAPHEGNTVLEGPQGEEQ